MALCLPASGLAKPALVESLLTPTEAGTRLRIERRGWDDGQPEPRRGFDQGWHDKLTVDFPGRLAAASPPISGGPS